MVTWSTTTPAMAAADLVGAAAVASVPFAYAFDVLSIVQLLVVSFFVGTVDVFFGVAQSTLLPRLVQLDSGGTGATVEPHRSGSAVLVPTD